MDIVLSSAIVIGRSIRLTSDLLPIKRTKVIDVNE